MMRIKNIIFRRARILVVGVCSFFVLVPFGLVYAVDPGSANHTGGSGTLPNPLSGGVNSFSDFVAAILNIVLQIGVPVAAVAIIYSGFLFLKAQGNDEELKTAKSALTWSIVGTAVLLGAWVFAEGIGATINALR